MGFKKILFGEKVPDKDDPKYKERYEKDVAAGQNFAKALHLDKGAACVQRFASKHTKLFLAIIFSRKGEMMMNQKQMKTQMTTQTMGTILVPKVKVMKVRVSRLNTPKVSLLMDTRISLI